jgi:hypothetical protein
MTVPPATLERHRQILGELAELSLALARRFQEEAMAAPIEEAHGLVLGFQRVSRSLRQTLALEARLERDHARALVEAARHADEDRRARVDARRRQVDVTLTRLIWTEGERAEIGANLVELSRRLDEECAFDRFLDGPVDHLINRLRQDLGLPANDAALDFATIAPDPSAPAGPPSGPSPLSEQGRMRGLSEPSDLITDRSG